jgi:hypothetical protein
MTTSLRIVFDGPPSPDGGRFVEVEDAAGNSVNAGTWHERPDGLWELRLAASQRDAAHIELGFGRVEVANGTYEVRPALIFGRNGTGTIGEATEPNRTHQAGETLAVITFANLASLEVVAHHIDLLRAALASSATEQGDKA